MVTIITVYSPMQKKLYSQLHIFLSSYVLAQAVLGIAVLNGWLVVILPVCAVLFALHRSNPRLKHLLPAVFIGNIVFMMIVISWFKNIDALGWQNIGPFNPNLVLMFAVFVASAFTSVFITTFWFLVIRLARSTGFDMRRHSYIYVWSTCMMLVEIIRTTSFSLFVSHSKAPIEPSLNLFSVGPLVHGTPLGPLSRVVGFWGSSFIVFVFSALLLIGVKKILARRSKLTIKHLFSRKVLLAAGAIVLLYGVSGIDVGTKQASQTDLNVVAVSQQAQDTLYLQKLAEELAADNTDSTKVVVLPEYSGLLHPFSEASLFDAAYDSREEIPKRLAGKPVYFVGTEDELSKNGRYVETYIVDSALKKIKRAEKTFLVPGGEYVPPWIAEVISRVDPYAVINFSSNRSRGVLGENLPIDRTDPLSRAVATAPCSMVLTPFHFRKQVAEGATLLTSNVSYEQFTKAPEYSAYVQRFVRFTAYSTSRPFVIGARAGNAMIYDNQGNVLANSNGALTATHSFTSYSEKRNIYVLLGDTIIVLLITAVALVLLTIKPLHAWLAPRRTSRKR